MSVNLSLNNQNSFSSSGVEQNGFSDRGLLVLEKFKSLSVNTTLANSTNVHTAAPLSGRASPLSDEDDSPLFFPDVGSSYQNQGGADQTVTGYTGFDLDSP